MDSIKERFNRTILLSKKDITGALAKWLVIQSPYIVPDNLEKILKEFYNRIPYKFDKFGTAEVDLFTMTKKIHNVLISIPDVLKLGERKNGRINNYFFNNLFGSREYDQDDDFIDILAVAQNITCEFADDLDAENWRMSEEEEEKAKLMDQLRLKYKQLNKK